MKYKPKQTFSYEKQIIFIGKYPNGTTIYKQFLALRGTKLFIN